MFNMMLKFVVSFVAIFAVALAKEDAPVKEITDGVVYKNQDPYSLNIRMVDEEQQFVDDNVLEGILGRSLIAETIASAMEDFRDVVINGNDSLPPLDPLQVETMGPFEFEMTGARAMATINNIRAEGLRWYVVDYVTFNALRLNLGAQITIPWCTVTGTYDAQARVALLLTHSAAGNFRVFINRLEVAVDLRMGTNLLGGHLLLRELDIKLDIADTLIQIDGMTGSPIINSFISSFVQNLTQDIVQNHLDVVSRIISEEVFDTVNDFLKDYTLSDLTG